MLSRISKLSRLAPEFMRAVSAGLRDDPPTYVDVGARGGLPRPWKLAHQAGLIKPVFVEPEPEAARALERMTSGAAIVPHALGAVDHKRETLHVTVAPGQTSLLRPDMSNPYIGPTWEVVKTIDMDVRRFDRVWNDLWGPPAFIKIDVQGYEVEVLKGMGLLLEKTLCVELECTFIPFYVGQPVFHEVHDFMTTHGFELVKIRPIGLYHGVAVVEFNAYFTRIDKRSDPRVRLWKYVNDVGSEKRIWVHGY